MIEQETIDERIPIEYRELWKQYSEHKPLYHLTTKQGLEGIKQIGHIEPRDPAPRNWAGMKAIFMADPDDALYQDSLPNVLAHARKKGDHLYRLTIKTNNQLYRSLDPERTFQVMSLDPIKYEDILDVEDLGSKAI